MPTLTQPDMENSSLTAKNDFLFFASKEVLKIKNDDIQRKNERTAQEERREERRDILCKGQRMDPGSKGSPKRDPESHSGAPRDGGEAGEVPSGRNLRNYFERCIEMSNQISSVCFLPSDEERLQMKRLILSSFLEVRTQDGMIPTALIKAHLRSPEYFS